MEREPRVDHSAEGLRIIDEFFAHDAEMSEENKLWEGLQYGVKSGLLTSEEADKCMEAYIKNRNVASDD